MSQDRRDLLQRRLDQSYQDYIAQLQKLPFPEVLKLAPDITAAQQICDELAAACDEGDIEALLALDDPLELLRDNWKREISGRSHGGEMGYMLWYLFKREEPPAKGPAPVKIPPDLALRRKDFEYAVRQAVPHPNDRATEAWWAYALEMETDGSPGFTGELQAAFGFIARNFRPETMQDVYGIITYGTALPSELTAAAVYLESGDTPKRMAELAEAGALMCFHQPKSADEASPLALVSVVENGKTETFYALSFGSFQPEDALRCAREYAAGHRRSVTGAIRDGFQTSPLRKKYDLCRNLYTGSDPELTKAMLSIFKTCPAVAAHITINADTGAVTTERNPLWPQAAKAQEPSKSHKKKAPKKRER